MGIPQTKNSALKSGSLNSNSLELRVLRTRNQNRKQTPETTNRKSRTEVKNLQTGSPEQQTGPQEQHT